ncbi:MAG: DUF120 domain-containing protein [Desulfurococcales archaeon]|jgi:CTP-dependent riboflavin kinase|nr:DUF120 domain-containing protein [Desulfurococcales archaeon]
MENAGTLYRLRLIGRYIKGLGRSGVFLGMDHYRKIFREKLSREPYPGTLNIEAEGIEGYEDLRILCPPHEEIEDIEIGGKKYGGLYIWRAKLRSEDILLIRPYRSAHDKRVLEIVAVEKLSDKLGLKEGELIPIEVECSKQNLS